MISEAASETRFEDNRIGLIGILSLAERKAMELARQHPEIAREFACGTSLNVLARTYFTEGLDNVDIAKTSIRFALQELLGEKRYAAIARSHFGTGVSYKKRRAQMLEVHARKGEMPYEGERRTTEYGNINEVNYICLLRLRGGKSWSDIAGSVKVTFGTNRSRNAVEKAYRRSKGGSKK